MTQKSRGAANLRTAPGVRHPSYATDMHFQPKKLERLGLDILFSESGLEIVGVPIKAVKSTRFLGVIIDEDLTWLPHI